MRRVAGEPRGGKLINDHRVRQTHVLQPSGNHLHRSACKCAGINADELDDLELAIGQTHPLHPGVKGCGPGHAVHGTDQRHIRIAHGIGFVYLLDLLFHHPQGRGNILERRRGPQHQAAEHTGLLRHEEGGKEQPHDEHEILGGITKEHAEGEK